MQINIGDLVIFKGKPGEGVYKVGYVLNSRYEDEELKYIIKYPNSKYDCLRIDTIFRFF